MAEQTRVAILGGGISGLACGVFLRSAGVPAIVIEASGRAGGVIGSCRRDGYLSELGPNSTLDKRPALRELVAALDLGDRIVEASPGASNRYVLRRGQLHPVPASPPAMLSTRLFSLRGRLRILGEPLVRRGGHPGETVASFVTRRFGKELLNYALDPFVSGVYAGDPEQLELESAFPEMAAFEREHGSVIRAAIHTARRRRRKANSGVRGSTMISFAHGMQDLTDAAARRLGASLRLNETVNALERDRTGRWRVLASGGVVEADHVVVSLPADAAATVLASCDPGISAALSAVPYAPVVGVFLGFRSDRVAHPLDGFGFLVPSVENRRILGTIFSSSLFPGRAPEGHVAVTVFAGGVRGRSLVVLDDAEILSIVLDELGGIIGATGQPEVVRIQRWTRAIPQYVVGHRKLARAMRGFEEAHPGVWFSANYDGGPSVVDCIHTARTVSDRVARNT